MSVAEGVVVARGLTKRYGDLVAVDNVSFAIPQGQVFGLLGPNGAGKTSTLEMIEGLRVPDAGEIFVQGIDARRYPARVKSIIGVQLQNSSYFDLLTVRETLTLFGSLFPVHLPESALIPRFELTDKANARVRDLSGGQRQRLSVALALVNDPRVVFLDEPSAGLDPQARRILWETIASFREEGRTVVLTTHYMDEAEFLADDLLIIDHGRIIAHGTPRELVRRHLPGAVIELDRPAGQRIGDLKLDALRRAEERENVWTLESDRLEDTLVDLVQWSREHAVPLEGLRTRGSTLEDVFLELTGRSLREENPDPTIGGRRQPHG